MNARLLASTFCVLLLCAIASFVSAQEVNVGTNNNHGHRYGGGNDDGNGHSGDHGGHPKPTPKPGLDGETDWNNTGTDFNTASNWTSVTGAIPPGAGDVAWFKVAKSTDPNLSASVSIAGLYFSSTASSGYTLSATSPFALTLTGYATDTSGTEDSNASAVAIGANNTSGTNTISAPIILAPATGSTSTFYQAGGATLVVSGVISGSGKGLMKTGAGTVSLTGANTYTGGTTVTGGVLQLGVNSAESGGVIATGPVGTGTLTLGTGTTLRSASANTRALQNNISLSGAITLGGTTPNNGTLVFNSSNLTTPATVSLTADTTLMLNSAVFINNVITGSGINLSKSGDILILGAANTFSGGFTANSGTTRLDVNNALGSVSSVTINNGATIQASESLINTINDSAAVSLSGTGQLDVRGVAETIGSLSSGSNTASVVIGDTVNFSGSLTVGDNSSTTFAGVISGSRAAAGAILTKIGTGTLTLSGSNTYTGGTTINAGTLSVSSLANGGSNSSIGASTNAAANLVLNGGTLRYTGAAVNTDRLFSVGTSGGTIDASGSSSPLSFTNGGSIGFNGQTGPRTLTLIGSSANGFFYPVIGDNSGATSLTTSGAAQWTLVGLNTYTGATTINGGELTVSTLANGLSNSNIGASSNAATNLILNGGQLFYNGFTSVSTDRLFSIGTNGGSINVFHSGVTLNFTNTGSIGFNGQTGPRTLTLTGFGNGSLAAVLGDNSGATSLNIQAFGGAMTWTLSGSNSYTGMTLISGGTLSASTLANGLSNSNIGASSNAATNLVFINGTLQYTGAAVSTDRLFSIAGFGSTGTLDASGSGAVNFTNTGSMGFNNGQIGARTLILTGTNTGNNTLAAVIGDNSGATGLTKSGAGTWILSAANTYTGATTIDAGTLSVRSLANGGSASSIGESTNAAANLVFGGGTLQYTGSTAASTDRLFTIGDASGNSATIDASGSSVGTLSFTNGGAVVFGTTGTHSLTLTGTNTGINTLSLTIGDSTGATSLTKNGGGTWVLSGNNSYTGGTTLSNGLLQLNSNNALGASSGQLTVNGGVLNLNDHNISVGNLTGSAGTIWNNIASNAVTLTIGNGNTGGGNYAGTIADNNGPGTGTGTVALTKTGTGTITLSGTNSYTGATTVNGGGALFINGDQSAATGAVTVNGSGTTLGGSGKIGGSVTVNSGTSSNNNLSPGASGVGSVAKLSTGALTLSASTNFNIDITGAGGTANAGITYDQLSVTGTVNLGGLLASNLVLNVSGLTQTNVGQKFFIVLNDATDLVSGTFAQGTTVTAGSDVFTINYADNGDGGTIGNDISLTLTAVPEPGTWVSAALAISVVGYSQRRRLRQLLVAARS